jgi:hypothetical protein
LRREVGTFEKGLILAPEIKEDAFLNTFASNYFSIDEEFSGIPFEIEHQEFVMNATETVVPSETGKLMIKMVESSGGTRHEHYLKEGEVQNLHNVLFAFNKYTEGAINITKIAEARLYGFTNINKMLSDSLDYKLFNTKLNTGYNEYNGTLYKNGIVFESNRINQVIKPKGFFKRIFK